MSEKPSIIDNIDVTLPDGWRIYAPDQGHPVTITPPDEPEDPSGRPDTYISLHYSPGATRVPGQPDGGHIKIGHLYVDGSEADGVDVFKFSELEKFVRHKIQNY